MRKYLVLLLILLSISIVCATPILIYTQNNTVNYSTSNMIALNQSFNASTINSVASTITPTYNESSPYNIPTNGLVAYWKFDEGTGSYVNDSSINNVSGTAINGMNWTTNGKYNNASIFDDSNDYAQFSNELLRINDTMTLCCFINPHGCIQGRFLYDTNSTTTYRNYVYQLNSNYKLELMTADGIGGHTATATSTLALIPNEMNFIAYTVNGTNVTFYVNNNTETKTILYPLKAYGIATSRTIGGTTGSQVLNATLDNMIVYNRTLNATEINQIQYDKIQELKLKTNSNVNYSSILNDSGTLAIPFNVTDSDISTITVNVPENVTINGITVKNYTRTITPFNVYTSINHTVAKSVEQTEATYFNSIFNIFYRYFFQLPMRLI